MESSLALPPDAAWSTFGDSDMTVIQRPGKPDMLNHVAYITHDTRTAATRRRCIISRNA